MKKTAKPLHLLKVICLLISSATVFADAKTAALPPPEVMLFTATAAPSEPDANQPGPYLIAAAPNQLTAQVLKELDSPFGRFIRQLDNMSRDYLQSEKGCEAFKNKTLLYLSNEDGGYARQGFNFSAKQGQAEFCDRLFVDMTVTETDLANGRFLEVFAHEMAHVFMRRLKGQLPPSASSRFHNVLAVTDYQTAFDEGFGIYFQTLAAVMSDHPGFKARIEGRTTPTGAEHWFSNIDGRERIHGVMHNKFVFEKLLPGDLSATAAYQLEGLMPAHSNTLKNAQSMLASEGVIATLLYRLVTSPDIFALTPDDSDWQAKALVIHRHLFDALAKQRWQSAAPPAVQFVQDLAQSNQSMARQIHKSLISTTYATTMDKGVAATAQRMIDAGSRGNMQEFVQFYADFKQKIDQLADKVLHDHSQLSRDIGNEIWLKQPKIQVQLAPWSTETSALALNLNAASKAELRLLQIWSEQQISEFVNSRAIAGPYKDLRDIQQRLQWSAQQSAAVAQLIANAKTMEGTIRR